MNVFLRYILTLLTVLPLIGCGKTDDVSSELAAAPTPCGEDNGIPMTCRTDRVREYTIAVDKMLRYTECGQMRTWKSFDPYLEGICGGVNAGKFAVYGPFLSMPNAGWINVRMHILPNTLFGGWQFSYFTPTTEIFAVDIYSKSLGMAVKRDVYHYSDFPQTGMTGASEIHELSAPASALANGKNLPAGWKAIEISGHLTTAVSDLELRIQSIHRDFSVSVLGMEMTYTKDP